MALRNIVKLGDDVLRKKCRAVTMIDSKTHQLLDDMAQTMHAANGVGLAAPQVGLLKRIVVIDVGDGVIEKAGWNTLGGWRIGVRGDSDGVYYYYAHLSSFYDGIAVGAKVKKGQLLGFVGDTGYGPVGTSGVMAPHLHFGMYEGDFMRAVNPYPMLRHWQKNS